jgi:AraC family ethanolamine operon transcriptional activator
MMSFDDFDAWGDAVSGAHLRLTCDSVERRNWTLGILDLGGVVLQVAAEGGGNLCYGANIHSGPIFFVPLTRAAEHVVNGVGLDEDSLFAIPRGADFSIRVRRRAHAWCSIALPADAPIAVETTSGSAGLACRPGSVGGLRRLVNRITATLLERPPGTAAHRAAGTDLVAALAACLPAAPPARPVTGRPRLDRTAIIRRSMETIEAAPTMPKAAELARQVGVTDRTLLRTFRETYDMPPKRYLMLRELHLIRRMLAGCPPGDTTVADVLTRQGIWEFGRFAGRYREHIGELPSATLARARA